jgi:GT2 family glycosyltransferase
MASNDSYEPEISVVVPTYNRLETLRVVLPSLLAQDLGADSFEVLLCDSNSTDGTAELARELSQQFPNFRHLPGAYSGRAMARNAGIAGARGELVLFNDADIIATPDLLRRHSERHRERSGIAVVGWEVQVRDYDEYLRKREHPHERGSLHPPTRRHLSWLYFLTGNASARRSDLLGVGGFDESFTGYGHEDLELGFRLNKAGIEIVYEPLAVNYHWQDVTHDDQKEKMRLAGRSAARFYEKHHELSVMLNLGMTPLWKGLHSTMSRLPLLVGYLDAKAAHNGFARRVVEQYYYVSGIKEAQANGKVGKTA